MQITNEIKVCKQHSLQPLAYQRCNLPQFLINESTLTIPSQWNDQQIWNVVCCCFLVQCISATHFIQILRGSIFLLSKTKSHACECALLLVEIFHRYIIPRITGKKNWYKKKMLIYFFCLINNVQSEYSSKEFNGSIYYSFHYQ